MPRPTYWLTRFVILRLLGAIYAVAFLVAINQIVPLIGANGLLPVGIFLQRVGDALGSRGAGFARLPSVFWFFHSDNALLALPGSVLFCPGGRRRLCECAVACCAVDSLYVICACGTGLVWIRMGDPVAGNRVSRDISLSPAGHASLSQTRNRRCL